MFGHQGKQGIHFNRDVILAETQAHGASNIYGIPKIPLKSYFILHVPHESYGLTSVALHSAPIIPCAAQVMTHDLKFV